MRSTLVLSTLTLLLAPSISTPLNYSSGGAEWTGLCSSGSRQSPIDLPTKQNDVVKSANAWYLEPNMDISFMASYNILNNVAVNTTDSSIVMKPMSKPEERGYFNNWDYKNTLTHYTLDFVDFRAPSEHTINEQHMDLEMRIFNYNNETDSYAALVVFFDNKIGGNQSNSFIDSL